MADGGQIYTCAQAKLIDVYTKVTYNVTTFDSYSNKGKTRTALQFD